MRIDSCATTTRAAPELASAPFLPWPLAGVFGSATDDVGEVAAAPSTDAARSSTLSFDSLVGPNGIWRSRASVVCLSRISSVR